MQPIIKTKVPRVSSVFGVLSSLQFGFEGPSSGAARPGNKPREQDPVHRRPDHVEPQGAPGAAGLPTAGQRGSRVYGLRRSAAWMSCMLGHCFIFSSGTYFTFSSTMGLECSLKKVSGSPRSARDRNPGKPPESQDTAATPAPQSSPPLPGSKAYF